MLKTLFAASALAISCFAFNIFAQTVVAPPKTPVAPRPPATSKQTAKKVQNESEIPAEKYIAADGKVNVSLCVSEGNVKINGWEQDEIRAFVKNGSNVGFSVRDKSRQTSKPNLVKVLGFDPDKNKEAGLDECLSGEEIELDVPRGAVVSLTAHESDISIRSVGKVKIENDEGNITLNEISRGIDARTYDGEITIEKSAGTIILNSSNGNIVAVETESNDVGDSLTAKTSSGSIMLQQIAQKQVEANSNTGAIRFEGAMENGGQYSLSTINGAISLAIPGDSSYRVEAFYGGRFQSEIPLKTITEDVSSQAKRLVAVAGAGDANLSLKTLSGTISIRKK